jgi:hypothetical protein
MLNSSWLFDAEFQFIPAAGAFHGRYFQCCTMIRAARSRQLANARRGACEGHVRRCVRSRHVSMAVDCDNTSPAVQARQEAAESCFNCSLKRLPGAHQRGHRVCGACSHQPLAPSRAAHSHSFVVGIETTADNRHVTYPPFPLSRRSSGADGGKVKRRRHTTHHWYAPRAAVKLPKTFAIPQAYNNSHSAPFVRIFSCAAFRSLGEESFGIRAAGGDPRCKHSSLAFADEFFWSKAHVTALRCEFLGALAD